MENLIEFAMYLTGHNEETIRQMFSVWEKKPYNDSNTLAKEIKKQCREHIKTDGLRFYGISWAELCRILEQHGYQDEPPF